jgi:hypothetical protein
MPVRNPPLLLMMRKIWILRHADESFEEFLCRMDSWYDELMEAGAHGGMPVRKPIRHTDVK